MQAACLAAGVSRTLPAYWSQGTSAACDAWNEVQGPFRALLVQKLEDRAIERVHDNTNPSDMLLKGMLCAYSDRWRTSVQKIEHSGAIEGSVKVVILPTNPLQDTEEPDAE